MKKLTFLLILLINVIYGSDDIFFKQAEDAFKKGNYLTTTRLLEIIVCSRK